MRRAAVWMHCGVVGICLVPLGCVSKNSLGALPVKAHLVAFMIAGYHNECGVDQVHKG